MPYSKFGLNQSCAVKSVQAAKGSQSTYLKVEVQVAGDKYPQTLRLVFPNSAWDRKAKRMSTEPALVSAARDAWKKDVINVFEALSGIKNLESQVGRYADAEGFINNLIDLMPEDYLDTVVDVFLEYEKEIRPGKNKKYLQFPMNSEAGLFFAKGTAGEWTQIIDDNGLRYVKGDREHPFKREPWYMKTARANGERIVESNTTNATLTANADEDYPYSDDLPF